MKISDITANLSIVDEIWVFKEHWSTFHSSRPKCNYITPICIKVEKLSFFYERNKGIYSINIERTYEGGRYGWINIGKEGEDYFLTKEEALKFVPLIKQKLKNK